MPPKKKINAVGKALMQGNAVITTDGLPSWVHYAILEVTPEADQEAPSLVEGPSGPFIFRDREAAEKSPFARGKSVVPVMLLVSISQPGEDV